MEFAVVFQAMHQLADFAIRLKAGNRGDEIKLTAAAIRANQAFIDGAERFRANLTTRPANSRQFFAAVRTKNRAASSHVIAADAVRWQRDFKRGFQPGSQ